MIEIKNASFQYANSENSALNNISLSIGQGECVLLCGESGCGKTTVTRLLNGLIPHYYEGRMTGQILLNGMDIAKTELYKTARHVGSVFQNPRSQFFCVDTTSEVAFGCENMGMPERIVHQRVHDVSEKLHITPLLGRSIFNLSGGEKQKIACASVWAVNPGIFVLDEPTSNLDIDAIEDLKNTLLLWKSQGKTVIISEHRLYWLKDVCDRVIYIKKGQIGFDLPMEQFRLFSPQKISGLGLRTLSLKDLSLHPTGFHNDGTTLVLKNYNFSYKKTPALQISSLRLPVGEIIAVIGHNGAGKSTFSKCLCGLEKKFRGITCFDGVPYNRKKMLKKCYMVMQDVNHQLFCESVDDEVRLGMDEGNADNVSSVLKGLDLTELSSRHPMSLSGGQKQRVAIASAFLANKDILLFDEPTSGLDFSHMKQTSQLLRSLKGRKTVFVVTHDPELVLRCCTHVLHLEKGTEVEWYPLMEENKKRLIHFFLHEKE
ncbi:MAG: ABC transporter ATP-binding protein [Oscillospiraceae bacterium]|jgi:energy-coupling factor transport system ATP-binding protein|nr:ABC transporter ATP-binding protein [Oscillospiraceae bacterium]